MAGTNFDLHKRNGHIGGCFGFESSEQGTKLSMKLTAQVQARILSKTRRHIGYTYDPNNKINEQTNKPKMKITNDTRRRNETDDKEPPKPVTEEDKARPV